MEEKFSPLIDDRNLDLWKDVNNKHEIQLEESTEPGYLTNFGNKRIYIQVDMEDFNPACLTHELLHIYLKDQGVLIAQDLKEKVEQDQELDKLFSDSLKEHLGNCLEHSKMLPLYLNREFNNSDFVKDFHKEIMNEEELLELRKTYYMGEAIKRTAFDKYVGQFFALKTSNNNRYDYKDIYVGLENLDPLLYTVLEKFRKGWQKYKIEDARKGYQQLLEEFSVGLREWKKNNSIIYDENTKKRKKNE